eukprot:m.1428141 g.1428141  ORF g.1428141 m.1428141 type:complete len:482 (+) comp25066_c0_seq42:1310-2755(+)
MSRAPPVGTNANVLRGLPRQAYELTRHQCRQSLVRVPENGWMRLSSSRTVAASASDFPANPTVCADITTQEFREPCTTINPSTSMIVLIHFNTPVNTGVALSNTLYHQTIRFRVAATCDNKDVCVDKRGINHVPRRPQQRLSCAGLVHCSRCLGRHASHALQEGPFVRVPGTRSHRAARAGDVGMVGVRHDDDADAVEADTHARHEQHRRCAPRRKQVGGDVQQHHCVRGGERAVGRGGTADSNGVGERQVGADLVSGHDARDGAAREAHRVDVCHPPLGHVTSDRDDDADELFWACGGGDGRGSEVDDAEVVQQHSAARVRVALKHRLRQHGGARHQRHGDVGVLVCDSAHHQHGRSVQHRPTVHAPSVAADPHRRVLCDRPSRQRQHGVGGVAQDTDVAQLQTGLGVCRCPTQGTVARSGCLWHGAEARVEQRHGDVVGCLLGAAFAAFARVRRGGGRTRGGLCRGRRRCGCGGGGGGL